jgi:hypothetical protein
MRKMLYIFTLKFQICPRKIERNVITKTIAVKGRGDPHVFETSRLPYFLENQYTDDG